VFSRVSRFNGKRCAEHATRPWFGFVRKLSGLLLHARPSRHKCHESGQGRSWTGRSAGLWEERRLSAPSLRHSAQLRSTSNWFCTTSFQRQRQRERHKYMLQLGSFSILSFKKIRKTLLMCRFHPRHLFVDWSRVE
jgi:hypothetical protein